MIRSTHYRSGLPTRLSMQQARKRIGEGIKADLVSVRKA